MTTISQVISISTNFLQNKIPTSSINNFYTLQRSILVVLWQPSEWQTPLHKDDVDNAEPVISDHNTDTSLNLLCRSWHSTVMTFELCGYSKRGQQCTLWESWKCSVVVWTTRILMVRGSSVASMIWLICSSLIPLWMHHKQRCPVHLRTITNCSRILEKKLQQHPMEMTQPVLGSLCCRVHQCIHKDRGQS